MGKSENCCSTQLINGDGEFNVEGLENFVKKTKLSNCGLSYAVVAIMGPQSSGKSTLMNHLFNTSFREMDAFEGRSQTTKGIWMARCVGIKPFTFAMDLEGTDGIERGEDDTTFEKQSALFALAVADIVMINMWCHEIGREQAANKPLLKTVFQVMMRLFSPRKTTLLFVIRDKTKTPIEKLEPLLKKEIQKIWDLIRKPEAHKYTPLSEFFNVEVVALSSYEEKEEAFKKEVAALRQRFFHSISPGGLAGDRRGVVPASGFSFSSQEIWKVIKENRDLDLPAHKVMVATVRCEEIADEKLQHLATDKSWLALQKAIEGGLVPGFGRKLSSILEKFFSEYDSEAVYFDEGVRKEKRLQLKSKALDFVHPAYATMLGHLRSNELKSFKIRLEQFLKKGKGFANAVRISRQSCLLLFDSVDSAVKQETWDSSKIREKLCHDIDSHASSAQTAKLAELTANFEKRLSRALSEPVESLFEAGGKETWPSIRTLLKRETETAVADFVGVTTGFELDHATTDAIGQNLKDYSQSLVEKKARVEADKILNRMKDSFFKVFTHDKDSKPRVWTGKEDSKAIIEDALAEALSRLSVMAAIRLDERPDQIESILFSSLMYSLETSTDPLASKSWEEVPPKDVLLTPVQCKSLWEQFKSDIEYTIIQAISAQKAHKRKHSWLPPAWIVSITLMALGIDIPEGWSY